MTNSTSKQSIKRASTNPERLNSVTQIIEPRAKTFVVLCGVSLLGLFVWSVISEVPVIVKGRASFVEPDTLTEIRSQANGLIFFRDDLQSDVQDKLDNLSELMNAYATKAANPHGMVLSGFQKDFSTLQDYASDYIRLTVAAQKDVRDLQRLKEVNNRSKEATPVLPNTPIAYILNASAASRFLDSLQSFRVSSAEFSEQQKQFNSIYGITSNLQQQLSNQVREVAALGKAGVLPESKVIDMRQQALSVERERLSSLAEIHQSRQRLAKQAGALVTTIYRASEETELKATRPSVIISRLIDSGQPVNTGQTIAIVSTGTRTENPSVITALFPLSSQQGLKPGMKVLVTPENVDANKFGSIQGRVEYVLRVPLDQANAVFKLGSNASAQELFGSNQKMVLAAIRLNESKTATGYQWTSSQGPSYAIPLGTAGDVQVITERQRPIELIFPFLRNLTGQQ